MLSIGLLDVEKKAKEIDKINKETIKQKSLLFFQYYQKQ